jgi:hypothetical protein
MTSFQGNESYFAAFAHLLMHGHHTYPWQVRIGRRQ